MSDVSAPSDERPFGAIGRILAALGPAWGGARRALNELHTVLRPTR